jgi:coatomer subunit beta
MPFMWLSTVPDDSHNTKTRCACSLACLQELKNKHRDVMQDVLMDILRALSSPNMDIRKKTLDIAMDLITNRNIDEVCSSHYQASA